ncbi:MAG TPA: S8 family serine peptidase, partial [Blastocatellia bacterium]|nr:S8 family serine peptidase [Blastocatellia bacterium]
MSNVICPNCRAAVPTFEACIHCHIPLSALTGPAAGAEPGGAPAAVKLSPSPGPADGLPLGLDPHLKEVRFRVIDEGVSKLATSSTGRDEVAVIGKVTDVAALKAVASVRVGLEIAPTTQDDHTTIVTARMPVGKIKEIRSLPFVKSLKLALRLMPALDKTVKEIQAGPDLPPLVAIKPPQVQVDKASGKGVVVGIVDFGLDFVHRNFRDQNGKTRVLAIWDQTSPAKDGPLGYGKVHYREDIDTALGAADPYTALGYGPDLDSASGEIGAHGTHVTDIAAGNGLGSSLPGVAPEADIVFVEASTKAFPNFSPDAVGDSFGDTAQLLEAISFIFNFAKDRPCVVNISLGANGGPHDGTTLVEEGINRLMAQSPNRAVIIAAGNSFTADIHASGTVPAGGSTDILWSVPSLDSSNNQLETWYSGEDELALQIIRPDGTTQATVGLGSELTFRGDGNQRDGAMIVANRRKDPNNGENVIAVFVGRTVTPGTWTLRLLGERVKDGHFHAWIERDSDNESRFLPAAGASTDNSCTLSSISCGHRTIVVGSYDAHDAALPISPSSSSGPTRDRRRKPEISAPGHAVL